MKRIRRGEKRKREFEERTRGRRESDALEEAAEWVPKTDIGRRVKNKEITAVEQIFELGKPIIEHQIVDILLPNLRDEVIKVSMTQRMTDCGRKTQFRAVVLVGDGAGHLGIGVGKADETKPAIETAIKHAKRNVIHVPLGCGSWECGCGQKHTLPIVSTGKNGSVTITLKPAPRGVGIVANEVVRKVLGMAGVKDAWSFARGRTRGMYNTAMAVFNALGNLNKMKYRGDWETTAEALAMEKKPETAIQQPTPPTTTESPTPTETPMS
ncbi:MAG: 30S ribosomal protein S5 [Candidatus Micrarchaeota archaeon]